MFTKSTTMLEVFLYTCNNSFFLSTNTPGSDNPAEWEQCLPSQRRLHYQLHFFFLLLQHDSVPLTPPLPLCIVCKYALP